MSETVEAKTLTETDENDKLRGYGYNYERLIELYRDTIKAKNKWIKTLFWVCIGLGSVIAFLLIFDILNPNMGYIRY